MSTDDDRTGSTPGQQPPVDPAHPGVPVDQQPTTELPDGAGQQDVRAEGLPEDGTAEHASVGSTPRRSRWSRARGAVRTPGTHRGRVVLAAVAAVALLLIGGGVGAAIAAEAGHGGGDRGGFSQDADGGRGGDRGDGQGGGRGDGQGDRGEDADDRTTDQDSTTDEDSTTGSTEESTTPSTSSTPSSPASTSTSATTTGN